MRLTLFFSIILKFSGGYLFFFFPGKFYVQNWETETKIKLIEVMNSYGAVIFQARFSKSLMYYSAATNKISSLRHDTKEKPNHTPLLCLYFPVQEGSLHGTSTLPSVPTLSQNTTLLFPSKQLFTAMVRSLDSWYQGFDSVFVVLLFSFLSASTLL